MKFKKIWNTENKKQYSIIKTTKKRKYERTKTD